MCFSRFVFYMVIYFYESNFGIASYLSIIVDSMGINDWGRCHEKNSRKIKCKFTLDFYPFLNCFLLLSQKNGRVIFLTSFFLSPLVVFDRMFFLYWGPICKYFKFSFWETNKRFHSYFEVHMTMTKVPFSEIYFKYLLVNWDIMVCIMCKFLWK